MEDREWHRDILWPAGPDGTPFGITPGQINWGYYLDDLTMENGPIVIVSGSHRALFIFPTRDSFLPSRAKRLCSAAISITVVLPISRTRAGGYV